MPGAPYARIRAIVDQLVFTYQLRGQGNHRNASVIFRYNQVMKYNKLVPVLIGMNKEGVVRADYKTKEV